MHRRHHRPGSNAAGALIVIAIGVLLLLNQNGVVRFEDVWRLWPLVLVIGGGVRMMQSGQNAVVTGGLMVSVGIVLELAEFHIIPFAVWQLWPVGVIAIGLLLLWRSMQPREYGGESGESSGEDGGHWGVGCDSRSEWREKRFHGSAPDHLSLFGGGQRRISDADFERADVLAMFGGYTLDLRKATMKGTRAVVEATSIFGGIEVLVPEGWNVIVKGVGIFGGYGDESHHPRAGEPAPELYVEGVAIFGGVAIKN